jgi:hypothetical protein
MAMNKEVIKRGTKAFDNHRIETSFGTKPMGARDPVASAKSFVDSKLVIQGLNPLVQ